MTFIQANDKFINLEHVSSFNILKDRVAFDLDCPVELDNGKIISYYAYNDVDSYSDDYIENLLSNFYVTQNFITNGNISINKNHISSVKFLSDKQRVIFNLSHSTSSAKYNKEQRLTSKFIYFNYSDNYSEESDKIKSQLGI